LERDNNIIEVGSVNRDISLGCDRNVDIADDHCNCGDGDIDNTDDIFGGGGGRCELTLLGEASDGYSNFADSEAVRDIASNDSSAYISDGSGDGEEAEREDGGEDGTETHCD